MEKASVTALFTVMAILSLASTVAATDYYRVVRRDVRKCASPYCGGYFVKKVNTLTSNLYVGAIDYSKAGKGVADIVDNYTLTLGWASYSNIMVYGDLVPYPTNIRSGTHINKLQVKRAYLGIPGLSKGGGQYYSFVNKTAVQRLNDPALPIVIVRSVTPIQPQYVPVQTPTDKSAKPVASSYFPVDLEWQRNQIVNKGAIVIGSVVGNNYSKRIYISHVFIKIPVVKPPCPVIKIGCDASKEGYIVYKRTSDLCFRPVCVYEIRMCPLFIPDCGLGYKLAGWRAPPGGCTAYVCDPIFTPRASKLNF